jgi:hypothetical protein
MDEHNMGRGLVEAGAGTWDRLAAVLSTWEGENSHARACVRVQPSYRRVVSPRRSFSK